MRLLLNLPKANSSRGEDAKPPIRRRGQRGCHEPISAGVDTSIPADSAALWIIPQKYFTQVGFDAFVTKPIGSGPYELAAFKNADSIDYKLRTSPHAFRHPIATEVICSSG